MRSILYDLQLELALHLSDQQWLIQVICFCQDKHPGNGQGEEEIREAGEPVVPVGLRTQKVSDHHKAAIAWLVLGEEGDFCSFPTPTCPRVKGPLHGILFGGKGAGPGSQELWHVTKGSQRRFLDNVNDHNTQNPILKVRCNAGGY